MWSLAERNVKMTALLSFIDLFRLLLKFMKVFNCSESDLTHYQEQDIFLS